MKDGKLRESDLTKELLHELFDYHEDGYLVWKTRPISHFTSEASMKRFNTPFAGKVVGYFNVRTDSKKGAEGFGYYKTRITLKSVKSKVGNFKVHRLIFAWHYGYFPEIVDHKDCDTRNNKISNLREADIQKNSSNIGYTSNNTTGYKGVVFCKKRKTNPWRASIVYKNYMFFLGSYSSKEEAACAYDIATTHLNGEFANTNNVEVKPYYVFDNKFFKITLPKILEGTYDWSLTTRRYAK